MATLTSNKSYVPTDDSGLPEYVCNRNFLKPVNTVSVLSEEDDKQTFPLYDSSFIEIAFIDQGSTRETKSCLNRYISEVLDNIAYFQGTSDTFIGNLLSLVFENPSLNNKMCVVWITITGEYHFNQVTIDSRSRFFPACKNLLPDLKSSNVRRALAVSSLRVFSSLLNDCQKKLKAPIHAGQNKLQNWDETNSGALASAMQLIDSKTPREIGSQLLHLGYLQNYYINSIVVDVVCTSQQYLLELNNEGTYELGDRVHYMWNSSSEYNPEHTSQLYVPPIDVKPKTGAINSRVEQLIYTLSHVVESLSNIQQDLIIPLRALIIDGGCRDLTFDDINTVFPPTLDEVAKVCCMLLNTLHQSVQFGPLETLKACAQMAPCFYKAFTRYKATSKNLQFNLSNFVRKLGEENFELPKKYRSLHRLTSILETWRNASLLKDPVNRLHQYLVQSFQKEKHFIRICDYYHYSISRILDSVSYHPFKNETSRATLNERITNWSKELHDNLLERDVVSVYHLEDLYNLDEGKPHQVLIVFTDLLLFFSIEEDDYYYNTLSADAICQPYVSDLVLDVLVNGAPCKMLPLLRFIGCCSMKGVMPLCYGSKFDHLKLYFNYSDSNSIVSSLPFSVRCYRILEPLVCGLSIIDTISKCKIMNKTQPCQLFKYQDMPSKKPFTIYSTAQSIECYKLEMNRSPFAIVLNMDFDEAFLSKYELFCAFFLSVCDDEVEIYATTIHGQKFRASIKPELLSLTICNKLKEWVPNLFLNKNSKLWQDDMDGNKTKLNAFKYWLISDLLARKSRFSKKHVETQQSLTVSKPGKESFCKFWGKSSSKNLSNLTRKGITNFESLENELLLSYSKQESEDNGKDDKKNDVEMDDLSEVSYIGTPYDSTEGQSIERRQEMNSISRILVRVVKDSNSHLETQPLNFGLMKQISQSENLMALAVYDQAGLKYEGSNWKLINRREK